jgi:hypothetical protein
MPPALHRRVLMHVCTHDDCDACHVDGTINLSQYLCYRQDRHAEPQPLRPLYFITCATQPSDEQAQAIRERASGGLWRRPSEHFDASNRLVSAPPDEDWLGWPAHTVPSEQQPAYVRVPVRGSNDE